MLVQLLEYDPLSVRPGMPGFGAGSKQPGVMFSFLKHLWSTASGHSAAEQQQQALFRCDVCWHHGFFCIHAFSFIVVQCAVASAQQITASKSEPYLQKGPGASH